MTLRNAILGLAIALCVSVWSWCRDGDKTAKAQDADPIYTMEEADNCGGGNHDEAARRYRSNQSMHWRQVAIRGHNP
jgi:hypothetical protein